VESAAFVAAAAAGEEVPEAKQIGIEQAGGEQAGGEGAESGAETSHAASSTQSNERGVGCHKEVPEEVPHTAFLGGPENPTRGDAPVEAEFHNRSEGMAIRPSLV